MLPMVPMVPIIPMGPILWVSYVVSAPKGIFVIMVPIVPKLSLLPMGPMVARGPTSSFASYASYRFPMDFLWCPRPIR